MILRVRSLIIEYTTKYDFKNDHSAIGFIRILMMFIDFEKYFNDV